MSVADAPQSDRSLRLIAVAAALGLPLIAWALGNIVGPKGQAAAGAMCFIAVCAACSTNLRAVYWRTVLWGITLQVLLALFILKLEFNGSGLAMRFSAASPPS